MQIVMDYDGLTVVAVIHRDRNFGNMLEEIQITLNGKDFRDNLHPKYLKLIEEYALDQADAEGCG